MADLTSKVLETTDIPVLRDLMSSSREGFFDIGSLPEVGGFRLHEVIGAGQSTVAFRATSGKYGSVDYAFLFPLNHESIQRFEKKAEVLSAFGKSPHVVQLIAHSEFRNTPYMVLEHGKPLSEEMRLYQRRDRCPTIFSFIKLADHVLENADYLHNAYMDFRLSERLNSGLFVVRDVHPSNIIKVSVPMPDRCCTRYKFSDLGDFAENKEGVILSGDISDLAYDEGLNPSSTEASFLGDKKGWRNLFAAPEVLAASDSEQANASFTPASDIYSIGVIFYLFLTNRLPVKDKNPLNVRLDLPSWAGILCENLLDENPSSRLNAYQAREFVISHSRQGRIMAALSEIAYHFAGAGYVIDKARKGQQLLQDEP